MNIKQRVNSEVLSSKIGNEIVLMSMQAESYFGLDPVGSRIWELLSKNPRTLNDLTTHLAQEYEIDPSICKEDVQQFIAELSAKNLVIPA